MVGVFYLLAACQVAVALTLCGASAAAWARAVIADHARVWHANLGMALMSLFVGLWWVIASPDTHVELLTAIGPTLPGALWRASVRIAVMALGLQVVVMTIGGVLDRGRRRGSVEALTSLIAMLPAVIVGGILCALMWSVTLVGMPVDVGDPSPLGLVVLLSVTGVVVSTGLNAGLLGRVLASHDRQDRRMGLVALAFPTLVLMGVSMLLFGLAIRGAGVAGLAAKGLWGFGPGPDSNSWLGAVALRFVQSYLGAVCCLSLGACVAFRITPTASSLKRTVTGAPLSAAGQAQDDSSSGALPAQTSPAVATSSHLHGTVVSSEISSHAPVLKARHYATLAFVASVLAFYASLVPMKYHAMPWAEAVEHFKKIPYYHLGIGRRADLMANFVLFVPLGYLAMGACEVGRRVRTWLLAVTVPMVLAFYLAWSAAIEFVQIFFPPRTVSQNDLYAQALGAAAGVVLWFAIGSWVHGKLDDALAHWHSPTSRKRLAQLYLLFLVGYSLLPMDFTMDPSLWAGKWKTMSLLTGLHGMSWLTINTGLVKNMVAFVPVGVILLLGWESTSRRRTVSQALAMAFALAFGVEFVQFFVYSGVSSLLGMASSTFGALMGILIATRGMSDEGTLPSSDEVSSSIRNTALGLAWPTYLLALLAVLWHPLRFDLRIEHLREGWSTFINWPFKWYYYSGEWEALNKVTVCMVLFAPVGVMTCWKMGSPRKWGRGLFVSAVIACVIGVAIEMGQAGVIRKEVYLDPDKVVKGRPFIADDLSSLHQSIDVTSPTLSKGMVLREGATPDITDVMAYILGAMGGYVVADLFFSRKKLGESDGPRHSDERTTDVTAAGNATMAPSNVRTTSPS